MELQAWIERLEAQLSELQELGTEVFVGTPATDETISSFELAMGVALPASYRALVRTYGWLELGGAKILGLERAEVQTRAAHAHALSERCIVVHLRAADGAMLCIDTTPRDRERLLVRFDPALGRTSSEKTTFSEWVSALVAESLQRAREEN